jgi:hypothetical protein
LNLLQRIKRYFSADAQLERRGIVYRRVTKYEPGEQGELATLECGHAIYLMPTPRREFLHCETCTEQARRPKDGTLP